MKIEVNRVKCVGLGVCEAVAPEHFEVGDDGQVILLNENFTEDELAAVEEAVRSCPTSALSLVR